MIIRIRFLSTVAALAVLTFGLSACGTEDSESATTESATAEHTVNFLFVQNAQGVSLADGTLTLTGIAPSTIYFSDRPERIAGHLETTTFTNKWGEGDDSFAKNPPNAALSILDDGAPEDIVVELTNPLLDGTTLTYDVKVLEGDASAQGESCALFIDVFGRPLTPISAAGVGRRVVRRNVYRRR